MTNGCPNETDLYLFDDPFDSSDDDPCDQGTSQRDLEEFYNSSSLQSADIEFSLVDADDEEDIGSTPWTDPEFAKAALRGLSDPRKKGGKITPPTLTKVTEEDFPPGPQRQSFIVLRHFAHQLCTKKTEPLDRILAARWLYSSMDKREISFDLCCKLLTSRADVIRLRLMFELWNRWIIFSEPIPRVVVPVPDILFDEIQQVAGIAGHAIAQAAWEWPGIPLQNLILDASGRDTLDKVPQAYFTAVSELEACRILSPKDNCYWLTGRNPTLAASDAQLLHSQPTIRGSSVTFSHLFD